MPVCGWESATTPARHDSSIMTRCLGSKRLLPRETQVMCDSHGNGLYFFDRDCSVQRRHQKVSADTQECLREGVATCPFHAVFPMPVTSSFWVQDGKPWEEHTTTGMHVRRLHVQTALDDHPVPLSPHVCLHLLPVTDHRRGASSRAARGVPRNDWGGGSEGRTCCRLCQRRSVCVRVATSCAGARALFAPGASLASAGSAMMKQVVKVVAAVHGSGALLVD
jgi:hypothetical protein